MKGCLPYLLLLLVFFSLYAVLFHGSGAENPYLPAGFCSVIMTISIGLIVSGVKRSREIGMFEKSIRQMPFRDGQRVAVEGNIDVMYEHPPLKSPFTGTDCVIYRYGVKDTGLSTRMQVATGSTSPTTRTTSRSRYEYIGIGMIPCHIKSDCGDIRLLSFPELENFLAIPSSSEAREGAVNYIRATTFPPSTNEFISLTGYDVLSNENPRIKRDMSSVKASGMVDGRILEEECVRPGDHVCLIGNWSAEKNAVLTPSPETSNLYKGNREGFILRLRPKMIRSLSTGIFLAVVTNVVVFGILYLAFWVD